MVLSLFIKCPGVSIIITRLVSCLFFICLCFVKKNNKFSNNFLTYSQIHNDTKGQCNTKYLKNICKN